MSLYSLSFIWLLLYGLLGLLFWLYLITIKKSTETNANKSRTRHPIPMLAPPDAKPSLIDLEPCLFVLLLDSYTPYLRLPILEFAALQVLVVFFSLRSKGAMSKYVEFWSKPGQTDRHGIENGSKGIKSMCASSSSWKSAMQWIDRTSNLSSARQNGMRNSLGIKEQSNR